MKGNSIYMPSITGYATEEQKEHMEELVEQGKYEDMSEAVNKALAYFLFNKHNRE